MEERLPPTHALVLKYAKDAASTIFMRLIFIADIATTMILEIASFALILSLRVVGNTVIAIPVVVGLHFICQHFQSGPYDVPLRQATVDYYQESVLGAVILSWTIGAVIGLFASLDTIRRSIRLRTPTTNYERIFPRSSAYPTIMTNKNITVGVIILGLLQLPVGVEVSQWRNYAVPFSITSNLLHWYICSAIGNLFVAVVVFENEGGEGN